MGNALPVGQIPVSLGSLGTEVGQMAGEEEVIFGRDGERVAHESSGVNCESASHGSGDAAQRGKKELD